MSSDTQAALQPLLDVLKQIDDSGLPNAELPGRVIAKIARFAGVYPVPHLAVSVCEKNFVDATTKATEEGKSETVIRLAGKLAYCTAMLLGIISGTEGPRLLYSAQVAHIALTKRPKKRGKSSHTSTANTKPTEAKSTT
jgi:hypothetical protein